MERQDQVCQIDARTVADITRRFLKTADGSHPLRVIPNDQRMAMLLVPTVDGRSVIEAYGARQAQRDAEELAEMSERAQEFLAAELARLQAERDCLDIAVGFECVVKDGRAMIKMKYQEGWFYVDGAVVAAGDWPE